MSEAEKLVEKYTRERNLDGMEEMSNDAARLALMVETLLPVAQAIAAIEDVRLGNIALAECERIAKGEA